LGKFYVILIKIFVIFKRKAMNDNCAQEKGWLYVRRMIQLLVVVAMVIFTITYLYQLWLFGTFNGALSSILIEHIPAAIGLPLAALASACIVAIFEFQSGSIEIKGVGFEFRGASGPIILWIFCLLAIVSAIKILW
jgi:hypothetical protein